VSDLAQTPGQNNTSVDDRKLRYCSPTFLLSFLFAISQFYVLLNTGFSVFTAGAILRH
jgi:hypothetical protein